MAPLHRNFTKERNNVRTRLNGLVEASIKSLKLSNIRTLKLKEIWDFECESLVMNDTITELGLDRYWDSIDAAVKFNISRREIFLAKSLLAEDSFRKQPAKEVVRRPDVKNKKDKIPNFFKRHSGNDRFHWSAKQRRVDKSNNRFLLPRVR